jgi:hypothetical protein
MNVFWIKTVPIVSPPGFSPVVVHSVLVYSGQLSGKVVSSVVIVGLRVISEEIPVLVNSEIYVSVLVVAE